MNDFEQCEVDDNSEDLNDCNRQKRNAPNYFKAAPIMANGNPVLGNKMQLFSKSNYNLAVYPNGVVKGTMDDNDVNSHLQLLTAGKAGQCRIQGMATKLYIAMNQNGHLYGEPDSSKDSTVFIESFQGSYNTYLSLPNANSNWYIGIKKSGEFKPGPETAHGQTAIMFLPRRSKFQ